MSAPARPPLPIVRLHLLVRADAPLALPAYAGSMLRGAWGHALKGLMPLPHDGGQPCALHTRCAYCQVFAPVPQTVHRLQKFSQMPAPYVIEPPFNAPGGPRSDGQTATPATDANAHGPRTLRAGETFRFGLVLIGQALQHLPTLVLAWQQACQRGLGAGKAACTLLAVHREGVAQPLWQAGQSAPQPLDAAALALPPLPAWLGALAQAGHAKPATASANAPPSATSRLSLHLHTPLRLQQQGRPATRASLTARDLLITLARRCQLLLDTQLGPAAPQQDFGALAACAQHIQLDASALRWYDWSRYSNRQRQSMPMGGLLGALHLSGPAAALAPFIELLHLGQWLHLGKETTFGLGRYSLHPGLANAAMASALAPGPATAPAITVRAPQRPILRLGNPAAHAGLPTPAP
ncbi:MAG: CRISPR system precrRNA processing endoribonuclease RAMP protein Cas6 [Comamonadaceae bacterium]|nr:CRISPR system precrRNA processing endoribonuclease RAMP protein Cas6 [Comamonadaceae bacterium]